MNGIVWAARPERLSIDFRGREVENLILLVPATSAGCRLLSGFVTVYNGLGDIQGLLVNRWKFGRA
jgi:hypothetical protein